MIKKTLLTVSVMFCILTVNAQAFSKGSICLNLGLGFGFIGDLTPAAHFSGEIGVIPVSNVGIVSFGGNADINVADFSDVKTHLAFRAAFHLGFLDTKKFDIYAGIGSGIRLYDHPVPVYFDEFVGARMMIKTNFGLFIETGYGATSIKGGITWIF